MLLRTFFIICFALLCSLLSKGQTTAPKDSIPAQKKSVESTEEVDGLLAFAGYLGKKLYDGVSNELSDEPSGESNEIKRVRIKLGPIKIERFEKR
jgi:hypothetical protein